MSLQSPYQKNKNKKKKKWYQWQLLYNLQLNPETTEAGRLLHGSDVFDVNAGYGFEQHENLLLLSSIGIYCLMRDATK